MKHFYVCPTVDTGSNAHYGIMEESEGKQVKFAIVPFNGNVNPIYSGKEEARQDAHMIVNALNNAQKQLAAVIDAKLALANWQKYNENKGDELVYQAEKLASALNAFCVKS